MRIAVLAAGTPAEVQRALALAEELARREQLCVRRCISKVSSPTSPPPRADLSAWLSDAEAELTLTIAHVTPGPDGIVLHAPPAPAPGDVLAVAQDGSWFRFRGRTVDLSGRRVLARIFATLAAARRAQPGRGVALDELVAAAWPNERMQRSAAKNRVRVALSTLRRLGLRDALQTRGGSILLDAGIELW